jgi:hypothetical protein
MVKSKAKNAEKPEPEPSVEPESAVVVTQVLPEETAPPTEETFLVEEKTEAPPEPKPDDILKVQAVWPLGYDDHKYEKGDIFEDTRERLSRLSQKHLKYL